VLLGGRIVEAVGVSQTPVPEGQLSVGTNDMGMRMGELAIQTRSRLTFGARQPNDSRPIAFAPLDAPANQWTPRGQPDRFGTAGRQPGRPTTCPWNGVAIKRRQGLSPCAQNTSSMSGRVIEDARSPPLAQIDQSLLQEAGFGRGRRHADVHVDRPLGCEGMFEARPASRLDRQLIRCLR
jgi:hypothetical protein